MKGTSSRLPRPCPVITRSDIPDDDDNYTKCKPGTSTLEAAGNEAQTAAEGLLPAPRKVPLDGSENAAAATAESEDASITPWSDLVQFSQVPEVPRRLASMQEIRKQAWPIPPPAEELPPGSPKGPHLPAVYFAKRHRFTVFNYSDLLQSDKSSETTSEQLQDEDEVVRFTQLSNKADYCFRVKNSYLIQNEVVSDEAGLMKGTRPRVCATCTAKMKASLLPDFRHKYRFTFLHTIHVYSPSGLDVSSEVSLYQKSKIEPSSSMKISPTGRRMEKLKPEIVTLLQLTHLVRVATTVKPDKSPAMMPRPLPPEFREPKLTIIDEDLYDRAAYSAENQEDEDFYPPPPEPPSARRPSRSEPEEETVG